MIVLNGYVWKVKIVNPNFPILQKPDGKYAVGVCDSNYKIICISNQLRGKAFKEVLCHEIVHAAVSSYGINIDHETEEFLANFISKYGHQIIQVTDRTFKNMKRGYL